MSYNQNNDGTPGWLNSTNLSLEQALFDIRPGPLFEDFTNSSASQLHTYVPDACHGSIDAAPVALAYGFTTTTLFGTAPEQAAYDEHDLDLDELPKFEMEMPIETHDHMVSARPHGVRT